MFINGVNNIVHDIRYATTSSEFLLRPCIAYHITLDNRMFEWAPRQGKIDNFTPNRETMIYIGIDLGNPYVPKSVIFSCIFTIDPRFFKKFSGKISGNKLQGAY